MGGLTRGLYRPLALGASVQALMEVDRCAKGNDSSDIGYLVDSILTQDASDLSEVFPDPGRYRPGIEVASRALAGERDHMQIIRYGLGVLELVRLLKADRRVLDRLGSMLAPLQPDTVKSERLFPLGEVYQQTISQLGKRIQVVGDPAALQQPAVAARIRTLLLAAVRFAWLWDQLGGRRWHFIVRRRDMLLALNQLSEQL